MGSGLLSSVWLPEATGVPSTGRSRGSWVGSACTAEQAEDHHGGTRHRSPEAGSALLLRSLLSPGPQTQVNCSLAVTCRTVRDGAEPRYSDLVCLTAHQSLSTRRGLVGQDGASGTTQWPLERTMPGEKGPAVRPAPSVRTLVTAPGPGDWPKPSCLWGTCIGNYTSELASCPGLPTLTGHLWLLCRSFQPCLGSLRPSQGSSTCECPIT